MEIKKVRNLDDLKNINVGDAVKVFTSLSHKGQYAYGVMYKKSEDKIDTVFLKEFCGQSVDSLDLYKYSYHYIELPDSINGPNYFACSDKGSSLPFEEVSQEYVKYQGKQDLGQTKLQLGL